MSDVYDNNSVAIIWNNIADSTSIAITRNGFSEVSQTNRNSTLVVFDHDLSILTGASAAAIFLCYVNVIFHLNDTSLLQRDANSLLSTAKYHNFGIPAYDASNHYSGKEYIHSGHQSALMKFDKALMDMDMMYVPIY